MPSHNQRQQWKRKKKRELEQHIKQMLQLERDLKPSTQPTLFKEK